MMARKIEGLTTYKCKNYSCWMTKVGCSRLKEKALMKPTKILFMNFNEMVLCKDCRGIK
jgi:hypothetical protein